jgi:hypothetical protein
MVRRIVASLGARGVIANSLLVDPVVASHSISGTEAARIDEADGFALLWTPEARQSPGVAREIEHARSNGREIVLLKWFDTQPPDWWDPDKRWVTIDRGLLMPCDSNHVPIFGGIIDRAFGMKDFGSSVSEEIIRHLEAASTSR